MQNAGLDVERTASLEIEIPAKRKEQPTGWHRQTQTGSTLGNKALEKGLSYPPLRHAKVGASFVIGSGSA